MSRRKYARAGIAAVAAIVAAAIAVPALAAAPPAQVTQKVVGGTKFVPNRSISETVHFKLDRINIRKGGTLTLKDTTKEDHTFSLVRKGQVPRSARAVEACFEQGPCRQIAINHGAVNPQTGEDQEPTTPKFDPGHDGFNKPGDSIIIPAGKTRKVKITSDHPLYYICAIHPWMLGAINAPAPR
jgi:hypothetical protein